MLASWVESSHLEGNVDERMLGVPWIVWGLACLLVAGIWLIVWPQSRVTARSGPRFLILRWAHALVWLLLAAAALLAGLGKGSVAGGVAFLALPIYLTFVVALFSSGRAH